MKTLAQVKSAAFIVALSVSLSSCFAGSSSNGNGLFQTQGIVPSKTYVTKKVSLSDIQAISSSSSVDVVYYQTATSTPYAEIYAPDNLIERIRVEESHGTLNVGMQRGTSIKGKCTYEVRVYAPEVVSFETGSSSDIELANGLTTQKPVSLSASSSGDITAESVKCGDLTAQISSSGDIALNRVECQRASVDVSSSGDVKMESLRCTQLKTEVSSSGDCKIKGIDCRGDVQASASSSGDIVLEGVCRNAVLESGSAGDVRADKLRAADVTASSSSAGDITCSASGTLDVHISSAGSVSYAGTPARITGDVKKASRM